ncbi:protein-disulfide reductase DsbD family protein [Reinekea thalattae]|nr:protein-disulfide reductase DsbD domain-containing protein [Reinekea thalattae]
MKWLLGCVVAVCTSFAYSVEFAPVDEAFQLNVSRNGDELYVDFTNLPNYYLYKDHYQIRGFDGFDASEPQFSVNDVVRYDETFDQQMTVFYGYMEVTHSLLNEQGYFEVTYQGCADAGLCYAPQKRYFDAQAREISAPNQTDQANPVTPPSSTQLTSAVMAAVFALLGGLVLNLMPCVFPVLSMKAFSLTKQSQDSATARRHAVFYSAGVILSFIAVAVVLLSLRHVGQWVGWGFQLQSPIFLSLLLLLFFIMALAMSGYISITGRWSNVGQRWTESSGVTGSFFTGVLATLVATPCTAPFMGSAIGFALSQPASVGLIIFAFMGLGLALPVLLIGFIPALAGLLPKPGIWMVNFQRFLAFPLLLTAVWLFWLLVSVKGDAAIISMGTVLVLVALLFWPPLAERKNGSSWRKSTLQVVILLLTAWLVFKPVKQQHDWLEYTPQLLQQSLQQDRPVLIDVTADWCITCKVNEVVALSGSRFDSLVEQLDLVLLRADWTEPSAAVDDLISRHNREGIPLYIYYASASAQPVILPQLLTPSTVEQYLVTP